MGRVHDPRMTSRANRTGFLASATQDILLFPTTCVSRDIRLLTPRPFFKFENFELVPRQINTFATRAYPEPTIHFASNSRPENCDTKIASTYTYSVGNPYSFPSIKSPLITQLPVAVHPTVVTATLSLGLIRDSARLPLRAHE